MVVIAPRSLGSGGSKESFHIADLWLGSEAGFVGLWREGRK